MSLAFDGIRVLDFSQVIAGPVTSQLLRQLGAEVIKIESTAGDQMRGLFRGGREAPDQPSEAFATLNRGKRSIALDLKSEAGRETALRLVKSCDVVLENFRAGAIERLGLGYDVMREIKPDIIYCSISGFGQKGPLAQRPAYDGVIQAISGMMMANGHPETGPTRAGFLPVDHSTGFMGAFAVASALLRRERTGKGQRIDLAMIDTALFFQSTNFSRWLSGGGSPPLIGNRSTVGTPTSNCFKASDGHILVATATRKQAVAFLDVLELPHALLDEYAQHHQMSAEALAIEERIKERFLTNTSEHWMTALNASGVPVEKVQDIDEVVQMEQLGHRNVLRKPKPEDASTSEFVFGGAFLANEDAPDTTGRVTPPGAETVPVLQEFGFSEAEIEALKEAGAIL